MTVTSSNCWVVIQMESSVATIQESVRPDPSGGAHDHTRAWERPTEPMTGVANHVFFGHERLSLTVSLLAVAICSFARPDLHRSGVNFGFGSCFAGQRLVGCLVDALIGLTPIESVGESPAGWREWHRVQWRVRRPSSALTTIASR